MGVGFSSSKVEIVPSGHRVIHGLSAKFNCFARFRNSITNKGMTYK